MTDDSIRATLLFRGPPASDEYMPTLRGSPPQRRGGARVVVVCYRADFRSNSGKRGETKRYEGDSISEKEKNDTMQRVKWSTKRPTQTRTQLRASTPQIGRRETNQTTSVRGPRPGLPPMIIFLQLRGTQHTFHSCVVHFCARSLLPCAVTKPPTDSVLGSALGASLSIAVPWTYSPGTWTSVLEPLFRCRTLCSVVLVCANTTRNSSRTALTDFNR